MDPEAWVLCAILFLWQLPHSLGIAWLYREDYARGGFRMLDADGNVHVVSHTFWAPIDRATGKLRKLPVEAHDPFYAAP